MRLKEDTDSWKAGGIIRRDFRHTHDGPEVARGHAKRKLRKTPRQRKPFCKHVWVEVSQAEYRRYEGGFGGWPWWLYASPEAFYADRASYTTYFVCAGCLQTRSKVDEGRRSYVYWKERRKRRAAERNAAAARGC
jgi:hypothetical protein